MPDEIHYSDYLRLDMILGAQHLQSDKLHQPAHDEMLFVIIHQAYELWFKQILFEVESVNEIMLKPALNDNSPELQTVVHRLSRCTEILKVLVHQIDVLETMTPMDFLDFRDMLRPASGFQSWQFKLLEARLGLKYEHRFGQSYYISQLRQEQIDLIKQAEQDRSLLQLVNSWLERMPFFDEPGLFAGYRDLYKESLADREKSNLALFDAVFDTADQGMIRPAGTSLSPKACRSALFIMLYRGYPILQLPFQLLNQLLEIDGQLSTWRYRHMGMVHRMIGSRIGTGGSTGKDYLQSALERHYIFKEIAALTSFLIERKRLPALDPGMERSLGFAR